MPNNEHDTPSRLLTACEVAAILGVAEKTVRNWRYRGVGPRSLRLPSGGAVRWREADVHEWIQRSEGEAA